MAQEFVGSNLYEFEAILNARAATPTEQPLNSTIDIVAASPDIISDSRNDIAPDNVSDTKHIWKPQTPQFCKEIAKQFGTSNRSVQRWAESLIKAFPQVQIRLPDDRYTVEAVVLMGEWKASGLIFDQWVEDKRPEVEVAKSIEHQSSAESQSLEVVDAELLVAPETGALAISTGYVGFLQQSQARLASVSSQEQNLLITFTQGVTHLNQATSQYTEAFANDDEALLRQAVVEGTELGFKYETLRQHAFNNARHQVRTGEVTLGKQDSSGEEQSSTSSAA